MECGSSNAQKRRERPQSLTTVSSKAKKPKQDADGGPSKEALLHGAFAYLAKVKEAFQGRPSVYAEFTTLLRDFRDKRVAIPAVVSQVLRLFLGHEELLQGFNVFLPVSYHLAYAEEIRRHKARLAANAEREALAEQRIPLHFLSAISPDPGVLHNHALSAGLPPGIIHWTAPESYFNLNSSLLNPILTLDRIPLHIAAVSPFSAGHAVTFFNTKLAGDLHILDAVTRGIEFWPLPVDFRTRRSSLDRRSKQWVSAKPQPGRKAGSMQSADDGATSSSRAAGRSKPAGKVRPPLLEGMVNITDADWGGSTSQYRQSIRRRKQPHEAYVICESWKSLPSESDEGDTGTATRKCHGSRRRRMLQRQDVLSNPAENPVQARRCSKLLHQYRRPSAEDAVDLLFRAKEAAGDDRRKYALLLRYLHKYFTAEMDAAKVYLGLMRLYKDHEDVKELLRPFFPGLETIGEPVDSCSATTRKRDEVEDPPSFASKRVTRKAALVMKGEDEDYVEAEEVEDWDGAGEKRPPKKKTHARLFGKGTDEAARQAAKRPSPTSSEDFPANNSPDLLKGADEELDGPLEEVPLALPLDAAALAEGLASSPPAGVKEDLPKSLHPSCPMTLDIGTLMRLKVAQARTVLERVLELEALNAEKHRLQPSRRTRRKAIIGAEVERDRESEAACARRAQIWEALEEPCRQLFEEIFSTWKGEAVLSDMSQGSVQACQEAAATIRHHLEVWEEEAKGILAQASSTKTEGALELPGVNVAEEPVADETSNSPSMLPMEIDDPATDPFPTH